MKLHSIDRRSVDNCSWTVRRNTGPHFLKLWHHHIELELVLILKGRGLRFIGDSIEKFDRGDLILIGKNLPHMWLSDQAYFCKDTDLISEAIAIHFKEDFLGSYFFCTPEMNHLATLIQKARFGIKFFRLNKEIHQNITGLFQKEGFERTLLLIEILGKLAKHRAYKLLASEGYLHTYEHTNSENLDKVHEYVFSNFREKIDLRTAAQLAHMHPAAFSRAFKRRHQKTFTRYVNEIRIGFACKLLIEGKSNITTICYESGFNNISNFNRQFKAIMGKPPSEYQDQYQHTNPVPSLCY